MPRPPRFLFPIGFGLALSLAGGCSGAARGLPTNPPQVPNATGPAARLQFRIQPHSLKMNVPATPAPQIQIVDTAGNVVNTATNTITLSSGSGNVHMLGTTVVQAVGGFATFSNVYPDVCCTTVQLTATAVGLASAATTGITISN